MEISEINLHLCYYDKRNPNRVTFSDGDIWKEKAEQGGCNCTNCFGGKSKLANAFLDYINNTSIKNKLPNIEDVELRIADESKLTCPKCKQPMQYAFSKNLRIPFCLCEVGGVKNKYYKKAHINNLQKHVPIIGKPKETDIK